MTYHRTAHDVVGSFDAGMQGMALGLGAALQRDRAIRQADRQAAAAIRARTARLAYDRVLAEETAAIRAQAIRADADRRLRTQRLMALAAAQRARG
ncbi:hypothetical protein [Methylorubrum extorquens]|jgi:hypothetical protein|uniref:Uncharacterized protein n=1 Tax=Methylorubrum extorquens (strain ATCC 14718 / DSM 1338 / JCM 2805 / NCIMB 9133 / AM1) TaxID=272630 RepID=C5AYJ3_METEA|nr:hypothetical protein [Methylorubrum extorquens]ACS39109.1 hypothetical protein MexAM1_META1p1245 [Methylorubrum extorquens AM1]MCP1542785.1 hypothetical protein [Methylorubrum extorquens]MCP1589870.1 hypothetical protein [Methylorubrum extorquens]